MTSPDDILMGIAEAISDSGAMPSETSYVKREVDADGAQAGIQLPIVEMVTTDAVRNDPFNTDLVGYATDDAGNRIGYIFHARFDMTVQINVVTVENGNYEPDALGQKVRRALLKYDANQMGSKYFDTQLPDGSGGTLDEVVRVRVGDGENNDEVNRSPAFRRWQQEVHIRFYDEINTAQEYGPEDFIETVDVTTSVDDRSTIADDGNFLMEYQEVDTDEWQIQITDQ